MLFTDVNTRLASALTGVAYRCVYRLTTGSCRSEAALRELGGDPVASGDRADTRRALMLHHTHHRRLLATVATAAALAATAPAALAMPIDGGGSAATVPLPESDRVRVVRVQVDEGLAWGDAGIGAAGMLALVLVGYGGAHALTTVSGRRHSTVHS